MIETKDDKSKMVDKEIKIEFIESDHDDNDWWACHNCGSEFMIRHIYPFNSVFCPHCGIQQKFR